MKKIIIALSLFLGIATAQAGSIEDISIKDLEKAIKKGQVTLLDVNSPKSYAKGHIPGAVAFSKKTDLSKVLPKEKDALIVAYCGGPRCGAYKKGALAAKKLGYTNVKHLSAGISGWKAAGKTTDVAKKE